MLFTYICTKFYEEIFNGLKVIELTWKHYHLNVWPGRVTFTFIGQGSAIRLSTAAWYGEHFVQSSTKILQLMQEIWSEHEKLTDRQTLNITFALWSWIVTFTFIRQGSVMRNIWHKFNKNSSIRYGDTEKSQKINR